VIVAQITDMHVKRRGHVLHHMPHVAQPLRRALATIAALPEPPQCVIATGDLTESGAPEEYARLREIVAESTVPVYLVAGNHDRREPMRSVFFDHRYLQGSGPIQYTIEMPSLRVIALDTSEGTRRGGYLDRSRLQWLADRLRERPATSTILAMHHPPFPTGVRNFDAQPFEGREDLAAIVLEHSQIRRIVCGHVHQPLARNWCGTICVSAPSTAPTLVLHPRAPGLSWEPGGFLLHRYEDEGAMTTELVRTASESEPVALTA
jgi:3',5'-cyclic-AMP phosphodiesterase